VPSPKVVRERRRDALSPGNSSTHLRSSLRKRLPWILSATVVTSPACWNSSVPRCRQPSRCRGTEGLNHTPSCLHGKFLPPRSTSARRPVNPGRWRNCGLRSHVTLRNGIAAPRSDFGRRRRIRLTGRRNSLSVPLGLNGGCRTFLEESCRRSYGSGAGDEGELWERVSGGSTRGSF
jgi:hypothetical protein